MPVMMTDLCTAMAAVSTLAQREAPDWSNLIYLLLVVVLPLLGSLGKKLRKAFETKGPEPEDTDEGDDVLVFDVQLEGESPEHAGRAAPPVTTHRPAATPPDEPWSVPPVPEPTAPPRPLVIPMARRTTPPVAPEGPVQVRPHPVPETLRQGRRAPVPIEPGWGGGAEPPPIARPLAPVPVEIDAIPRQKQRHRAPQPTRLATPIDPKLSKRLARADRAAKPKRHEQITDRLGEALDAAELRRAIVLAEIVGPPVSLRGDGHMF